MRTKAGSRVGFRPIEEGDRDFLCRLYASTREDEIAAAGWDTARAETFLRQQFTAQRLSYASRFPEGEHRLLLLDGEPVGRLYVARSSDEIRLLDIALLPRARSRGIGTPWRRQLQAEASATRRPLRHWVERNNPRAARLYDRLGFRGVGYTETHLAMEWRAPQGP